ncbi:MAG: tRNA-binding protein [Acidimicrobiia bacterium]
MPTIDDWTALGVRIGRIVRAQPNDGAREPAFSLWIDFGDLGELQSSARITDRYRADELVGKAVVAVTGFEPMHVGGFRSDVLVIGALTSEGVVLIGPDRDVAPGTVVA